MKRKPLLKHTQVVRLSRILDMMYKPAELAREIGVTTDTVYRSYLPAGLPHTREKKQIWIYGPSFIGWAKQTVIKHRRHRRGLPDDHAWCVQCKSAVLMMSPVSVYSNRYIEIMQARCPICGRSINRARSRTTGGIK